MEKHTIYLAGGCFWGMEAFMRQLPGVLEVRAGYANGRTTTAPTYEAVCRQDTGHAETVEVIYDPSELPLALLVQAFLAVIDPTSLNKQGNDRGSQYRSGIYYTKKTERPLLEAILRQEQVHYAQPIVTELEPLRHFYPAEEWHQNYLAAHPGGYCHLDRRQEQLAIARLKAKQSILRGSYPRPAQEELAQRLTPLQYKVTQEKATERPFANPYAAQFERGIYVDRVTGEPLFLSDDKFDAGCGWPSFARLILPQVITEAADQSFGMQRTEVLSRQGGSHLGHVFDDGPQRRGGQRYCINSAALRFIPYAEMEAAGYGELKCLLEA